MINLAFNRYRIDTGMLDWMYSYVSVLKIEAKLIKRMRYVGDRFTYIIFLFFINQFIMGDDIQVY